MQTTVKNSTELRIALNENLEGLLTGSRKAMLVKEVNNTIGKLLFDVKMELQLHQMLGSKFVPSWFDQAQGLNELWEVKKPAALATKPKNLLQNGSKARK